MRAIFRRKKRMASGFSTALREQSNITPEEAKRAFSRMEQEARGWGIRLRAR